MLRTAVVLAMTLPTALCDDVTTVRQRMMEAYGWPSPLTSATVANVSKTAQSFAAKLFPNGTWPDVNYNDSGDRTLWQTSSHMNRVSTMAAALSIPGSPVFNEPSLFNSTRLALNAWYKNDWKNVNWWWDIIFCPQIHSLAFLMLDTLPKAGQSPPFPSPYELDRAWNFSVRATWWDPALGYEVTGANLAWMVQAQLMRGTWPSLVNMSALSGGFSRLWEEAKVVDWDPACSNGTNQGVQVDGAYHMHGPQLQTAAYGQDYSNDMLQFLSVSAGTEWDIDPTGLAVLCTWLADGYAWQVTGMGVDWAASGRQISRNSWASESKVLLNTTLVRGLAARCSSPQQADILSLADRIDNVPGAAQLTGHKALWTSDYAVQRRQGWTAAWHGHSTRTLVNECGNGENLHGMLEGQGVLNLYDTICTLGPNVSVAGAPGPLGWGCGLEYATIFPLIQSPDYRLRNVLNGVTARIDDPVPPPNCNSSCCWESYLGMSTARPFVGSASDGTYGVSAFDSSYLSLSSRKSYLFFDRAVVVLGTNVTDTQAGRVGTGLASRFMRPDGQGLVLGYANSSVTSYDRLDVDTPAGQVGDGSGALAWAWADGVGWLPNFGTTDLPEAAVFAGYRNEAWSIIGPYTGNVSGLVLSLAIVHQANATTGIVNNASFGTVLVPGVQGSDMTGIAQDPLNSWVQLDPSSVANAHDLQAAVQANATDLVLLAVFWHSGSYSYSPAQANLTSWAVSIQVDQPCLVVYSEHRPGPGLASTVSVAVSNPDTTDLSVTVTVTAANRSGCGPLTYDLNPADQPNYLGAGAVQTCTLA